MKKIFNILVLTLLCSVAFAQKGAFATLADGTFVPIYNYNVIPANAVHTTIYDNQSGIALDYNQLIQLEKEGTLLLPGKLVRQEYSVLGFNYQNTYEREMLVWNEGGMIELNGVPILEKGPINMMWYLDIIIVLAALCVPLQVRLRSTPLLLRAQLHAIKKIALYTGLCSVGLALFIYVVVNNISHENRPLPTEAYSNQAIATVVSLVLLVFMILMMDLFSKKSIFSMALLVGPTSAGLFTISLAMQLVYNGQVTTTGPWYVPTLLLIGFVLITYVLIKKKLAKTKTVGQPNAVPVNSHLNGIVGFTTFTLQ